MVNSSYFGDAFADVGAAVRQLLLEQHPGWTEQQVLDYVTNWYVTSWNGNLYDFFNNSGITNPANKGKEVARTLEYYGAMLAPADIVARGWCRVSGQYGPLYLAGRDNQILVGSGAALNFHHGLDKGLLVGGEALLSIYFMPLGCIRVSDKVALVHSNRPDVTAMLAALNMRQNLSPVAAEVKPGLAKSKRGNPANALFAYVDEVLYETERRTLQVDKELAPSLTLYHFTNQGKKPDIVLYHLSAVVFEFYRNVVAAFKEPWNWFVRAHYRNGKFRGALAQHDVTTLLLPGKPNEVPTRIEPDTYQAWSNGVYLRLIQGQSLLPLMKDWAYTLWRNYPDQSPFPFELTAFYCEFLLHMKHETLALVARLAHYIAADPNESFINRTRRRLSTIRTAAELRLALTGLQRRNYESEAPDTLFTLDEYVSDLFPEGMSWREVRNMLLISLYEQLHKQGKHLEAEDDDLEEAAIVDARLNESEDTDNDE